jgi:hypothetical protein
MMCPGDLQRWGRSLNVRVAPSQTKYDRRIFLYEIKPLTVDNQLKPTYHHGRWYPPASTGSVLLNIKYDTRHGPTRRVRGLNSLST